MEEKNFVVFIFRHLHIETDILDELYQKAATEKRNRKMQKSEKLGFSSTENNQILAYIAKSLEVCFIMAYTSYNANDIPGTVS